jgi:zinc/manganese transport system substrate-binding protein
LPAGRRGRALASWKTFKVRGLTRVIRVIIIPFVVAETRPPCHSRCPAEVSLQLLQGGKQTKVAALCLAVAMLGCACSGESARSSGVVAAVGAENEYANVISQVGGRYVKVTAILSNPNTDPHSFEASPSVAGDISSAQLVVQNGVGYDTFMNSIEAASPNPERKVIDVQKTLGLPDSTLNPHLWYDPGTMPAVAEAISRDLSALDPAHASYFRANLARFDRSLDPWLRAMASFKADHPDTPVATTEPVADYMLEAAGAHVETPWALQADIMNGVDPAPQDITAEGGLFTGHKVKVFLYNEQVTDSITQSFLELAKKSGIPVVGVYETMPVPGYDYQTWMLAEVRALDKAVADKVSTERL